MSTRQLQTRLRVARTGFDLDVEFALDLTVPTGVFGPSGSGKTTLLRAICGLEPDSRGLIVLNGRLLQSAELRLPAWRRGIAMVFQDPQLFAPDVQACLQLGVGYRQGSVTMTQVVDLLDLGPLLARQTSVLSGGETRRVAIAQALLSQPELLLLDEPLSGLDEAAAVSIGQRLKDCFAALHLPVILVSHRVDEMLRMTDHLVLLEAGQIVASGATGELATDPDLPLAHSNQARSILRGQVVAFDTRYALASVAIDGETLWLPASERANGSPVELVIGARDVSITRSRSEVSSILNIIAARVIAVAASGPGQATVSLALGEQRLLAHITRKSADLLNLRPGDQVWAQIKSVVLAN